MTTKSMTNVPEVCRTCLKQIQDPSELIYLKWMKPNLELSYQEILKSFFSLIDLTVTPNAKICKECLAAVDLIYAFKETCLQTEHLIHTYLSENASTSYVDLLQVVCWSREKDLNFNNEHVVTNESSNMSDLIHPVEQEHCYARKRIDESNTWQEKCNKPTHNSSMIYQEDVVGDVALEEKIDIEESPITQCETIIQNKQIKKSPIGIKPNERPFFTCSTHDFNKINLQKTVSNEDSSRQKQELGKSRPFKCTLCTFTCISKTMLCDHGKMHTGEKHYKCNLCSYRCNFKSNLQNHMKIHTGKPNPFYCNVCNFSTPSRTNLTVHVRTHTGEKPYKCKKCLFKCNNENRLKFHTIVKHTKETPFKCELCNYSGKLKSYLVSHMKTHTGEKPYKCETCDYKFRKKTSLITHERLHKRNHETEKPFKCKQCKFRCADQDSLNIHIKGHPRKPYACVACPYKCTTQGKLTIHMRIIHKGLKSYKCTRCEFRCKESNDFKNHMKQHTGPYFRIEFYRKIVPYKP